jgi:hypothetical protein
MTFNNRMEKYTISPRVLIMSKTPSKRRAHQRITQYSDKKQKLKNDLIKAEFMFLYTFLYCICEFF